MVTVCSFRPGIGRSIGSSRRLHTHTHTHRHTHTDTQLSILLGDVVVLVLVLVVPVLVLVVLVVLLPVVAGVEQAQVLLGDVLGDVQAERLDDLQVV